MAKKRLNDRTSIQVTRETFEALERLTEATGLSKAALASRIVLWFEAEPREIQAAITDSRANAANEIVRLKLSQVATDVKHPQNVEALQAIDMMRTLLIAVEARYLEQQAALPKVKRATTEAGE